LRDLPRHERPLGAVSELIEHIETTDVRRLAGASLSQFLDQCQQQISTLHQQIHARYFDLRAG
jgi:hypothetical protein